MGPRSSRCSTTDTPNCTGSRGVARPPASVTLYGRASHPTEPMRIAVLHDHLSFIGGGERVALALAAGLGADRFATDFDPGLPMRTGLRGVPAPGPAERAH